MKRWAVPAVPFVVSLCLSGVTVGKHPYWQDSGLYLTALKELGVLYPPGFALYEFLCFLWAKVLFFVDFTLAVHLFSSFCAALTAGTLAIATRDVLRSRGRIFRVTEEDPGELADLSGMVAGIALACGFTFWSTAIYAKGYTFYYLILSLLLWAMIRADGSGKPRDFAIVAVLIGLAWQAHPSSALAGFALILFVGVHGRSLGWKAGLGCVGLAAVSALGPSLVLLPWIASREPWLMMGRPNGVGEAFKYLTARRFLAAPGVFGLDASRVSSFGIYFWEELLGVGALLLLMGLVELARRGRWILWGMLAWLLPYAAITILFKMEGQHDCWFVAAWMPLYLALGVGAFQIGRAAGAHARPILLALALAGTSWAVLFNLQDVTQRDYVLAEAYGRALLEPVDRDAILLLGGDDATGIVGYLQRVRGERPDVLMVTSNFLYSDVAGNWYDEILLRRHPFLRAPDYASLNARFSEHRKKDLATAAFLNANAGCGRPLFCEQIVPLELIRPDYTLVPAGATWKLLPQGAAAVLDRRYWKFPIEPEQMPSRLRRARGQKVKWTAAALEVEPERYEERLSFLIVMARLHLAMALTERGDYLPAANLCGSILALDSKYWSAPEVVHHYAISLHAAGDSAKAEPALRRSAEISVIPRSRATASFYLGEIARKRGNEAEALRCFGQSLSTPGLDDATRREIESRLKQRN
jgi:hypothetical protein